MIPVQLQPEPAAFAKKVRKPGERFLAKTPNPKPHQWNKHSYWTRILSDLHQAYSGVCAYAAHYIPSDHAGAKNIDHFKPKSKYPNEAYRNYSEGLCRSG